MPQNSYNFLSQAHIVIWELERGGWVVVWLVIDLIAARGGYKKRESPNFRSPGVGISAKCIMSMIQIILFKLKFSHRRILSTVTRGYNWRVVRRICVLMLEWGTETYRELWDVSFILFLFGFSTFFLFITQPMGLLICWFILTIDNVFTLKTKIGLKKRSENAHLQPQFTYTNLRLMHKQSSKL